MDDLQYLKSLAISYGLKTVVSFKPCYKWMTFNTKDGYNYEDFNKFYKF